MSARLTDGARDRLQAPFDRLSADLRARADGRRVLFLQNDGNYGDGLIRAGTLAFLGAAGFEITELDMSQRLHKIRAGLSALSSRLARRTLHVYAGSGAWSSFTSIGRRNVARLHALGGDFFVLPTTFEAPVDLGTARFAAYVRDQHESAAAMPGAPFCHDMAFFLALQGLTAILPRRVAAPSGTAIAFRTDNESSGHGLATRADNRDFSAEGNHMSDIGHFLAALDAYERIVTDRLHVAIAGIVLGKDVDLVPGGYFKIAAIYRSSIAGNFEGVRLVEDVATLENLIPAA
ncbi:MAG: polysaccharide pyruvyl transferase family protein [Pseudomonadota bacterium]